MSVSRKDMDSVNAILTVKIGKEDYQDKVEKELKELRKKAKIPGFRPGNVPMGMIQKMYGKSALAEQVNKLISDGLYGYIKENNLNILGEPLPVMNDKQIDFEKDDVFEFSFEIGLAPEIDVDVNAKDKVTYYEIEVTDEMVAKQMKDYTSRTGKNVVVDGPSIEGDMIRGDLSELGKEDGLKLESVIVMASYMSSDDEKKKFESVSKDQEITFNPSKAYDGKEQEIRYLLHLEKDADVSSYTNDFLFKVTEISRFEEAPLNQELFDQAFGAGVVTTEEEFKGKIREALALNMTPESDYKFFIDVIKVLKEKAGDVQFPEAFLKRVLASNSEGKTAEQIDEEYPKTIESLTWHLIKEKLVKKNNLTLDENDLKEFARKVARNQFAQYGMLNAPDEIVDNYTKDMLKDQKTLNNIVDRAIEEKLIDLLKSKATLVKKSISMEEFHALAAAESK